MRCFQRLSSKDTKHSRFEERRAQSHQSVWRKSMLRLAPCGSGAHARVTGGFAHGSVNTWHSDRTMKFTCPASVRTLILCKELACWCVWCRALVRHLLATASHAKSYKREAGQHTFSKQAAAAQVWPGLTPKRRQSKATVKRPSCSSWHKHCSVEPRGPAMMICLCERDMTCLQREAGTVVCTLFA